MRLRPALVIWSLALKVYLADIDADGAPRLEKGQPITDKKAVISSRDGHDVLSENQEIIDESAGKSAILKHKNSDASQKIPLPHELVAQQSKVICATCTDVVESKKDDKAGKVDYASQSTQAALPSSTTTESSKSGTSGSQVGGVDGRTTGTAGRTQSTQSTGTTGSKKSGSDGTSNASGIDGDAGEAETTTVDLYDQTNTTLTIDEQTSPASPVTPVPEATNFVLDDVPYQFLEFKSNATSYVMGGLLPLTRGGKSWLGGVQYVEAFKCQLNILNSNSRILPVSLITYLIQNTDELVSLATQQAYLLQLKNVFMNVGPPYDDQVPPVAYLYAPERLSALSFQASSVFLSNATTYPSFFRTIPSDTFQARAMAETMRLFGWNFVAALFTTDTYGTSGRSALLSQTGRQRIKVTCTNSINPGSTSGLSSFADCVSTSDASVVVLWSILI